VDYVSDKDMFATKNSSYKLVNDDYASPLMIYTAKTFNKAEKSTVFSPALSRGAALSMTQELYWNLKKGIFQVTSDKIQGAAGFLKGGSFKSKNLRITCQNEYASVFLISLDMKPLSEAEKIILNTGARVDNTGVQYSPSKTSVIFGGSAPIIVEPVYSSCTVTLKSFKSVKVYTLDANGYKAGEYTNWVRTGNNSIVIKTDEKSKTLNYYIEILR
jgi:hypothetical protein